MFPPILIDNRVHAAGDVFGSLLVPMSLDYTVGSLGKRCTLWRFDRKAKQLGFILDLLSRGDTCFRRS